MLELSFVNPGYCFLCLLIRMIQNKTELLLVQYMHEQWSNPWPTLEPHIDTRLKKKAESPNM